MLELSVLQVGGAIRGERDCAGREWAGVGGQWVSSEGAGPSRIRGLVTLTAVISLE